MTKIHANNLEELQKIAEDFAKNLNPGDVVCMTGDLGAGKTTFTQFVAKKLGITEPVQSPTFNILLQHKSPEGLILNHFDLYRLENADELDDIAFYETIEDSNSISFIEWAEKFKDEMPESATWLIFTR